VTAQPARRGEDDDPRRPPGPGLETRPALDAGGIQIAGQRGIGAGQPLDEGGDEGVDRCRGRGARPAEEAPAAVHAAEKGDSGRRPTQVEGETGAIVWGHRPMLPAAGWR
jgi:hypothetical protein